MNSKQRKRRRLADAHLHGTTPSQLQLDRAVARRIATALMLSVPAQVRQPIDAVRKAEAALATLPARQFPLKPRATWWRRGFSRHTLVDIRNGFPHHRRAWHRVLAARVGTPTD